MTTTTPKTFDWTTLRWEDGAVSLSDGSRIAVKPLEGDDPAWEYDLRFPGGRHLRGTEGSEEMAKAVALHHYDNSIVIRWMAGHTVGNRGPSMMCPLYMT